MLAHLPGSVSRFAGGPFESIRRLCQELAQLGCRVEVIGYSDQYARQDLAAWEPLRPHLTRVLDPVGFGISLGCARSLWQLDPDLIHLHGLWRFDSVVARVFSGLRRRPLVVSPRGMLEPWALSYRRWKKAPVWWLWERRVVSSAAVLHATSDTEAANIRRLGIKNAIAVIPNGVDIPDLGRRGRGSGQPDRTVLFLSRIHPKKGLLNLVRAWALVRPAGWHLVIAGPDEGGHEQEVRRAVREAGMEKSVVFRGPVYGDAKWELLRSADVFVLPSYSENFGVAVAEALACGVPVITTQATPWDVLSQYQCGWWVPVGVEPLARALREAIGMSDAERRAMGERGRRLVEEKFSWPKIAREMREVYEWVLGGGPKPGCVRTD